MNSPTSTTVLAGFPNAAAALEACANGALASALAETQLVELCGAFTHEHVAALRRLRSDVPVGLVTYAGNMTNELHAIFEPSAGRIPSTRASSPSTRR